MNFLSWPVFSLVLRGRWGTSDPLIHVQMQNFSYIPSRVRFVLSLPKPEGLLCPHWHLVCIKLWDVLGENSALLPSVSSTPYSAPTTFQQVQKAFAERLLGGVTWSEVGGVNISLIEMGETGDKFGVWSLSYCAKIQRKQISPPHLKVLAKLLEPKPGGGGVHSGQMQYPEWDCLGLSLKGFLAVWSWLVA